MTLLNYLINIISLKQTKKYIFISKECPFTKYKSKKRYIFRINTKLKVCKCFHCGLSAKDISWLIIQLENKEKAEEIIMKSSLERYGISFNEYKEITNNLTKCVEESNEKLLEEDDLPF